MATAHLDVVDQESDSGLTVQIDVVANVNDIHTRVDIIDGDWFLQVGDKKIRKTSESPPRISVYDLIATILNESNPRTAFKRMKQAYPEIGALCTMYKFPGKGHNTTPVIEHSNADTLIKIAVGSTRMSLVDKRKILGDSTYFPVRLYTEVEIHTNVQRALAHIDVQFQYCVGYYRIDMYFPEQNIAVECDENDHSCYSVAEEKQRHDFISDFLHCKWIRYNPYAKEFNIFDLINKIFLAIHHELVTVNEY